MSCGPEGRLERSAAGENLLLTGSERGRDRHLWDLILLPLAQAVGAGEFIFLAAKSAFVGCKAPGGLCCGFGDRVQGREVLSLGFVPRVVFLSDLLSSPTLGTLRAPLVQLP